MKELKYIDIKEFREKGYLQEVNRQFLHPLGLALVVDLKDNGEETIKGVADYRDDDIFFGLANRDDVFMKTFKEKVTFITMEFGKRVQKRIENLGFFIEPIEKEHYEELQESKE